MDELVKKLIASGFADLEGLRVTGSIPVKQELVNDAIQAVLQDMTRPKAAADVADAVAKTADATASAAKAVSKAPPLPKEEIVKMVKRAEVKMQEGRMVIEFDVQR